MKKIDIGQSLQTIANLGVLLGILLLVYELTQTRELARAQFNIDRDTAFQTSEIGMLGDDLASAWAKALLDPESLSVAEIRALDSYYAIQISRLSNTWDLERDGILPSGSARREMELSVPFYFGNSFAHLWWSYDRVNWNSDLVALMDEVLADVDDSANRVWIEGLQNDLSELTSP